MAVYPETGECWEFEKSRRVVKEYDIGLDLVIYSLYRWNARESDRRWLGKHD